MSKTNDRVRSLVSRDLAGEEVRGVVHFQRTASEGSARASGTITSRTGGGDVEAALLARHGLDAGPVLGQGTGERRDLIGSWLTVTDAHLAFHAPDTGFWRVRPRPAELRAIVPRREIASIEYADHEMTAMVWRTWLLRFDDGTWLIGNTPVRGRTSQIGMNGETDLVLAALGDQAVALET